MIKQILFQGFSSFHLCHIPSSYHFNAKIQFSSSFNSFSIPWPFQPCIPNGMCCHYSFCPLSFISQCPTSLMLLRVSVLQILFVTTILFRFHFRHESDARPITPILPTKVQQSFLPSQEDASQNKVQNIAQINTRFLFTKHRNSH